MKKKIGFRKKSFNLLAVLFFSILYILPSTPYTLTPLPFLYAQDEWEEVIPEEMEEESTVILPVKLTDLNTATIDELLKIPGITPSIATNIANYAIDTGFKSVEDLKSVAGITEDLYQKVKDYFTVKPPPPVRPLTTKLTFRFISRTPAIDYYNYDKKFQNPYYLYNKAEFRLPNRTEFGWVIRQGKDGATFEPPHSIEWSTENIVKYNLTSWWIDTNNFAGLDKLVAGSYVLGFGQGLIFYKRPSDFESFLYTESKVKSTGIEVYKTSRKNDGLNGLAVQKSIGPVSLYGFYSYKKLSAYQFNSDGSIANALEGWEAGSGNPLKSIYGEIQSEQDIEGWERLESKLLGGRVSFDLGKTFLGFTGFTNEYSPDINPPTSYGYHLFRGNRNFVYGFDFDTWVENFNIFGEIAKSENKNQEISEYKGTAGIVGFMTEIQPFKFINKYFYYAPNYHNEYSGAHTFDYAPDINQQGAFFETEYKYSSGKMKLNYTIAKYPWINEKYEVFESPHSGSSLYFEINQNLSDAVSLYFRQINTYKEDRIYMYSSPVYDSIYKDMPENKYKTRVQLTWRARSNVNLRFRYDRPILETYKYDYNTGQFYKTVETANLVFGEFSTALSENLFLSGRATIFHDAGLNGVYVSQSEPYWPFDWASWSPRFDYNLKEGSKYYLILKQRLAKGSWFWIKYANFFNYEYQRTEIPSDTEQVEKVTRTNPQEIRIQYDVQF